MAGDLRIIAGKDIEAREARKAARKAARPLLERWINAGMALARDRRKARIRQDHVAMMRELTRFPSANEGHCFAGQSRLGAALGVTDRTARKYLAELVAAGLLVTRRRGVARTSIWSFCIDGKPIFPQCDRNDPSSRDRNDPSSRDRNDPSSRDRNDPSDKLLLDEPLEDEPFQEQAPSPGTPQSSPGPRAKGTREIADEIVARLPAGIRQHRLWRSLTTWIDALTDDGYLDTDIVGGVLLSLPSLNAATPSSLRYFEPAINRARNRRESPLPALPPNVIASVSIGATERELCRQCGVPTGAVKQRLGAERLADLHRRYQEGVMVSTLAKEIYDEVRL